MDVLDDAVLYSMAVFLGTGYALADHAILGPPSHGIAHYRMSALVRALPIMRRFVLGACAAAGLGAAQQFNFELAGLFCVLALTDAFAYCRLLLLAGMAPHPESLSLPSLTLVPRGSAQSLAFSELSSDGSSASATLSSHQGVAIVGSYLPVLVKEENKSRRPYRSRDLAVGPITNALKLSSSKMTSCVPSATTFCASKIIISLQELMCASSATS
eukprot:1273807-Prymnesium_polylepis.2